MSTLRANETRALKSTSSATMQRIVLFNLTQEVYPAPPSSSRKKSLSHHFFTIFASFQVNKCPLYGQMRQGLKIDLGIESSGQYSLTSHKKFSQPNHPLQEKIR